jgi:hypothetical protein
MDVESRTPVPPAFEEAWVDRGDHECPPIADFWANVCARIGVTLLIQIAYMVALTTLSDPMPSLRNAPVWSLLLTIPTSTFVIVKLGWNIPRWGDRHGH